MARVRRPADRELIRHRAAPVTLTEGAEEQLNDIEAAYAHVSYADEVRIRAARRNVNDLIEFAAIPRERYHLDGTRVRPWERLVQTPFHERLQEIWDTNPFTAVMAFPASGKTTQVIWHALRRLGVNPDLCIAIVSQNMKSEGLAARVSRTMRLIIERSRDFHRVYPNLKPGPIWQDTNWMVQKTHFSGEMTCQIVGEKNEPTGQRLDLVICDDLITGKNTRDEKDRLHTSKWFRRHIIDRLGPDGRVIFLCNAHHPRDLFHQWEGDPQSAFKTYRFPVLDANDEPTVPEIWPRWRIDRQRAAMSADGSTSEFDQAYMCIARADEEVIFDHVAVTRSFCLDVKPVHSIDHRELPPGAFVVVAVDPATRKTKKANYTAFTVALYWPVDRTRQVLWVKAGKYKSTEIAQILFDLEVRYSPVFHVVENNAAQVWLEDIIDQWMQIKVLEAVNKGMNAAFPSPVVFPYHTGTQKVDPTIGLDGLSAEISGNRWVFPSHRADSSCHVDLTKLFTDLVFCRRVGHTPDRLMSLWLCREGMRFQLLRLVSDDNDSGQDQEEDDDVLTPSEEHVPKDYYRGIQCPRCGGHLGQVDMGERSEVRVLCPSCNFLVTVAESDDYYAGESGTIMRSA